MTQEELNEMERLEPAYIKQFKRDIRYRELCDKQSQEERESLITN